MPQYTLYHDEQLVKPIFAECFIDNISNLKVGDYLVYQRDLDTFGHPNAVFHGTTQAWNITRITKKCVFIEYGSGEYIKSIRLAWKNINPEQHPGSLYRGYLENNSYEYVFHRYVKQEDMNLEPFLRNTELQEARDEERRARALAEIARQNRERLEAIHAQRT